MKVIEGKVRQTGQRGETCFHMGASSRHGYKMNKKWIQQEQRNVGHHDTSSYADVDAMERFSRSLFLGKRRIIFNVRQIILSNSGSSCYFSIPSVSPYKSLKGKLLYHWLGTFEHQGQSVQITVSKSKRKLDEL